MKPNGKKILVIGAGNGIGRGVALSLRQAGYYVIGTDLKHNSMDGVVDEAIVSDFFSSEARANLLKRLLHGVPLAGLVCGPYPSHDKRPLREMTWTELGSQIEGILGAPVDLARLFLLNCLQTSGEQTITFIGSEMGGCGMLRSRSIAYDASKAGLIQATQVLARECVEGGLNVRVNLVAPGATDTPGERLHASETALKESWRRLPAGRPANVLEIGQAVRFVIENQMMRGATLVVNGGEHLI